MEMFALIVSVASGIGTVAGVVGLVVKIGRDKGESAAEMRELRKDVDRNAKDIDALGTKVTTSSWKLQYSLERFQVIWGGSSPRLKILSQK